MGMYGAELANGHADACKCANLPQVHARSGMLEGREQEQSSDVPALHSSLQQDHVLKGLP